MTAPDSAAALVVAHPGHEIRVHGWLRASRPTVCVLTDGSGHRGEPRIASTSEYLRETGVHRGPIYGGISDRDVYSALLDRNFDVFIGLTERLATFFVTRNITAVAGDAAEGYNSTHDVCRLIIDSAVSLAGLCGGRAILNYDFPVVGRPDACPDGTRHKAIWRHLTESEFAAKLDAARKHFRSLVTEMESALLGTGTSPLRAYLDDHAPGTGRRHESSLDMFRVECLRWVGRSDAGLEAWARKPFYETQGERQVAAGVYHATIRYHDHIAPLADALRERVARGA